MSSTTARKKTCMGKNLVYIEDSVNESTKFALILGGKAGFVYELA